MEVDIKYSNDHLWVKTEGPFVRIGISNHLQSELDEVVFVELPEIDEYVKINDPFVNLESVKTVSELYAPVSGRIIEINVALENDPKIINSSPNDKGWLVVLEPTDRAELDMLLSEEAYEKAINK